jgi:DNA-binding MarR family transcriptional regulator
MAVVTSVMRAQQILLARVDAVLGPFQLTFARYEALMLLHFSRAGQLPLGKLGERLQVHPASVTNVIDRLEAAGLVRRVPHPDDGRTVLASITPAGRRLALRASAAMNADVFESPDLGGDGATALFDALRELRHAAGDFADH